MPNVSACDFVPQQTIRELFDVNEGEKREAAVELSVPQTEEEEAVNKQSTTILEQVRNSLQHLLTHLCASVGISDLNLFFRRCAVPRMRRT